MHSTRFQIVTLAMIVGIMLSGCSNRPERWGVLLWSADETVVASGAVVPIFGSSQLNKTLTIRPGNDIRPVEIEEWRVEVFKRQREAASFAEEYAPFNELYGVSLLDKLRVRAEPGADSIQLYKLRKGEVVKVIHKQNRQETIGEYTGYWYEVLTSGGVRGFTFSEYLQTKTLAQLSEATPGKATDSFLDLFFHSTFRPDYYRDMRKTGKYDISRFLPEYGIFPDREKHRIRIVTEEHETTIEYTKITRPTEDSYAFEGSSLILTRVTENWVNLIYSDDGVRFSENFVYFPDDIEALIAGEIERRQGLLERFMERGNVLESSAYGTMELQEDGSFVWSGYDRLVPDIVSSDATGAGTIEFSLFLDDDAAARFDGAVMFRFAREVTEPTDTAEDTVRFLYAFGDKSVRFTFVPEASVERNIVKGDSLSPIILFFTYM